MSLVPYFCLSPTARARDVSRVRLDRTRISGARQGKKLEIPPDLVGIDADGRAGLSKGFDDLCTANAVACHIDVTRLGPEGDASVFS